VEGQVEAHHGRGGAGVYLEGVYVDRVDDEVVAVDLVASGRGGAAEVLGAEVVADVEGAVVEALRGAGVGGQLGDGGR
jgi:hypothetical protein